QRSSQSLKSFYASIKSHTHTEITDIIILFHRKYHCQSVKMTAREDLRRTIAHRNMEDSQFPSDAHWSPGVWQVAWFMNKIPRPEAKFPIVIGPDTIFKSAQVLRDFLSLSTAPPVTVVREADPVDRSTLTHPELVPPCDPNKTYTVAEVNRGQLLDIKARTKGKSATVWFQDDTRGAWCARASKITSDGNIGTKDASGAQGDVQVKTDGIKTETMSAATDTAGGATEAETPATRVADQIDTHATSTKETVLKVENATEPKVKKGLRTIAEEAEENARDQTSQSAETKTAATDMEVITAPVAKAGQRAAELSDLPTLSGKNGAENGTKNQDQHRREISASSNVLFGSTVPTSGDSFKPVDEATLSGGCGLRRVRRMFRSVRKVIKMPFRSAGKTIKKRALRLTAARRNRRVKTAGFWAEFA
ncbi:hypothetical protein B0H66DRAFT_628740, partial [Apodospora peruviana]